MYSQFTNEPRYAIGPFRRKFIAATQLAAKRYENWSWAANAIVSKGIGKLRGSATQTSDAFDRVPLMLGKISQPSLRALQEKVFAAPRQEFKAADHAPGYVWNPDDKALAAIFNSYHFRQIDGRLRANISEALREVAPEVSRHLGSGWKVMNLKSWTIRTDTAKQGPNAWHLDGLPIGTFKLMIYLTPIGPETGTTEVRFADGKTKILEGEPGTFLLFDPSVLWHRGVSPTKSGVERTHIEISLMRSIKTDLTLVEGGLNSAYPRTPWVHLPARAH